MRRWLDSGLHEEVVVLNFPHERRERGVVLVTRRPIRALLEKGARPRVGSCAVVKRVLLRWTLP
jgi:hypothetical protein